MRRFSVALIGAVLLAACARAAYAAPPGPAYNWTGFYIGLNAGWGWGKAQETTTNSGLGFAFADSTHPNGLIGGVQFGYNWQVASPWIVGFEADIQASGQNASSTPINQSATLGNIVIFALVSDSNSHNDALNWFGTVRGRLGYAVWPGTMVYGTGGFAYGRVGTSVSNTGTSQLCFLGVCGPPISTTATLNGAATEPGWTGGGGIEGAVPNSRVTWKIEYLYIALNTANFLLSTPVAISAPVTLATSAKFTDNIVRVGLNWHY